MCGFEVGLGLRQPARNPTAGPWAKPKSATRSRIERSRSLAQNTGEEPHMFSQDPDLKAGRLRQEVGIQQQLHSSGKVVEKQKKQLRTAAEGSASGDN